MARQTQTNAQNTYGQASGATNTASTNANSLYNTLTPQLTNWATNPPGMTPTELSSENTAAQQSAGGGEAAAKGELGLAAARSRNRGAYGTAVDASARNAMQTNSTNALKVQN